VLVPLVAGIRTALGAAEPDASATVQSTTSASPAQSREAATQLAALLSDSDAGAVEFIQAHRDALRPLFDATSWVEFDARVQSYAFEDAQAQLERALEATARSH
jgi:ribulose bisphosphate carboxylase small subunit